MDVVLAIHSLMRFIVLLVAVVGIVKALVSLVQKSASDKMDQTLASVFVGLYDLQMLLGILVILLGGLKSAAHPVVMFIGILVAHGLQRMIRRAQGANARLYRLGLFVISLVIILIGISVLPAK